VLNVKKHFFDSLLVTVYVGVNIILFVLFIGHFY
jgi:hypothetical protein